MEKKIKIKDLVKMELADIDVEDNYVGEVIAYCGTLLTEDGERKYAPLMDIDVELHNDNYYEYAVVLVDDGNRTDGEVQELTELLHEMLRSMAGFCSEETWDKYFRFE